jgi:hypothetical protein
LLGVAVCSDQIHWNLHKSRKTFKRAIAGTPVENVLGLYGRIDLAVRPNFAQGDEAVRARKRQGLEQNRVDHSEDCSGCANAQRQRGKNNSSET